jgi:hypothetical protein
MKLLGLRGVWDRLWGGKLNNGDADIEHKIRRELLCGRVCDELIAPQEARKFEPEVSQGMVAYRPPARR